MNFTYIEPGILGTTAQFVHTEPFIKEPIVAKQPSITLIYRGNTFEHIPDALDAKTVEDEVTKDWLTVTLTYRGRQYIDKIKLAQA